MKLSFSNSVLRKELLTSKKVFYKITFAQIVNFVRTILVSTTDHEKTVVGVSDTTDPFRDKHRYIIFFFSFRYKNSI